MKHVKTWSVGLMGLALAASAQAGQLFSEGFENLATAGWSQVNKSSGIGQQPNWFQGDAAAHFSAQSGSANSYAAVNYLSGKDGGTLSNWLISPVVKFGGAQTTLNFALRGEGPDGFFDTLKVYFSAGSGTDTASFVLLDTLIAPTDDWGQFSYLLPASELGRFAFEYSGLTDNANFLGLDAVSVVPEPGSAALIGISLLGLLAARRSARRSDAAQV